MFTGLIEQTGKLLRLTHAGLGGSVIEIASAHWDAALQNGESIAVCGTCLTVTQVRQDGFACDVLNETLHVTSLGKRQAGALLNLERALRIGDRLGGHFVTGHIDGTGTIHSIEPAGRDFILRVSLPAELARDIIPRGSIAIEGISLTVAEISSEVATVHVIPTTWQNTNLFTLRTGDTVNIETDLLGKLVRRQLGDHIPHPDGITAARLIETGFI